MLDLILYIIAAVFFALAAFGVAAKVNWIALGLLTVALIHIFDHLLH